MINITIDVKANAMYIKLQEGEFSHTEEIDDNRCIDYDREGNILGIDLCNISEEGVNFSGFPQNDVLDTLKIIFEVKK
jgi:uncharacterized protein YuzE